MMLNLDESLGFLINKAAFAMKRALEKRLADFGLTAPQWAFLARLWQEDGQSPGLIGKSLYFDKTTATGIVDRLEQKGLVKKVRDTDDRRIIRVYLTDNGKKLQMELPQLAVEVNKRAIKGFDKNDLERLKSYLRMIWNNFEE